MALFLLVVLTVSCVIKSVQFKSEMGLAAEQLAVAPDFSFSGGQVHFTGQMPYVVKEPDANAIFIVDTTGQTTPDALKGYDSGMLITKDKYYQIQAFGGVKEQDLSQIPASFTKADIVEFLPMLWILVPIGYVFIYGFQLGFKALDACILGLVALIWGSATRRRVPFNLGFKLGLYAMTLPIVIQWIVPGYSTIPFMGFGTLGFVAWWAIAIAYLLFGLQATYNADANPGEPYSNGTL